jgi:predicted Zn finger-like uncharacterized protein
MLIVCPSCTTSYQVEPASLGAAGRSVRCVRCRHLWFASNSEAIAAIARAHRDDVAALQNAGADGAGAGATAPSLDAPSVEAAEAPPPLAPTDETPAEPAQQTDQPADQPADTLPERDDRGPAPLPEPRSYEPPPPPDPVIIDVSPPPVSADQAAAPPVIDVTSLPEDIETVATRRTRRVPPRRAHRTPATLATTILLLITINAGLIASRAEVVGVLPQTASLYAAIGLPVNLRELVFSDIATRHETHDGVQVLIVEGNIKSQSRRVAEVPRLRFAARNGEGHEIYTWTALPTRNAIAPGAAMPFSSRLASPPPETHAVLVRFFNRRDLDAGAQ